MRRVLLLIVLCLASCKSTPPPPPDPPRAGVRVDTPWVNVNVQKDGGTKVYDPSGLSGVPTVVVPGR